MIDGTWYCEACDEPIESVGDHIENSDTGPHVIGVREPRGRIARLKERLRSVIGGLKP